VAVRTGSSTLNWLVGDHLGSTTVTANSAGVWSATQLYKPWGEARYTSGTLPTDYKYTGQRETVLGLYDYKARFYDPVLGRFLQADTIVPGAGNPLAWDRYAYTLNNPVRYTDPSGHECFNPGNGEKCTADPDSNGHWLPAANGGITANTIKNWLKQSYNWNMVGDWKIRQLGHVMHAGYQINQYVSTLRGGMGIEWMRKYLGGTNFHIGGWNETFLKSNVGPTAYEVRLLTGFETMKFSSKTNSGMIILELGHVLDNRVANNRFFPAVIFGGGPADALIRFVGGEPTKPLRFLGDVNIPAEQRFVNFPYGNNSSADYFAQTFAILIVDTGKEPELAGMWMNAFISCLSGK